MERTLIAICGPTAVGKTAYAIEVARALNGEIVSCDSMQLYRYMEIGSAKPTAEELAQVPHHLVGVVDPAEPFSVAKYQRMARDAIEDIFARGRQPVVAGGTGLYLNALLYDMDFSAPPAEDPAHRASLYRQAETEGPSALHRRLQALDPEAAARIHPNNVKKVVRAVEAAEAGQRVRDFSRDLRPCQAYRPRLIGLHRDRSELYARIDRRVDQMMAAGLPAEVRSLLDRGLTAEHISMKGIGYKELIDHFRGHYSLETAVDLIKQHTRHYAKRQMTWFRRYADMQWFHLAGAEDPRTGAEAILQWLQKK